MADPEEFSLLRPILCMMDHSDEGWSLIPGQYVGVAEANGDAVDFREHKEQVKELNEELRNAQHRGARMGTAHRRERGQDPGDVNTEPHKSP